LYANWEILSPFLELGISNPFAKIFLISGYLPDSKPDDPYYRKTYWDLAFLLYHIVFFSFTREMVAIYISKPASKYFGIKRSKLDRFGEQTYALLYFTIFGAWGYVRVFFLDCFFLPV
jgi:very-long-chain ceramide synthase